MQGPRAGVEARWTTAFVVGWSVLVGAACSVTEVEKVGLPVEEVAQVEAAVSTGHYLPWACGQARQVTQGNYGGGCNVSHYTADQLYAWDFEMARGTPVRATKGGRISRVAFFGTGDSCYNGCGGAANFDACCDSCISRANFVNVDHGDGTVGFYTHLDSLTVKLEDRVNAGDVVGYSGQSGCTSGPHLHYQLMGNCPAGYCNSIAANFVEKAVPVCYDVLTSQNCGGSLLANVPRQRGVYHKDGRQEVFARGTDNTIWHSYQTAPNAGWVAWSSFGGNTFKGEPTAYVDAAGRLTLFAVAADGTVWRKTWAPGGTWSAWLSHGGTGAVGQVFVAENTNGILEAFVRRSDNTVWRIKQSAAGSSTWGGWATMGGSLASEPVVGRNADGRLEVFAQGTNNTLYHAWQSAAGGTWSAFYSMPATLTSAPTIARNSDGRLEVFGRGTDGRLFKIFQQALNGNWSTWFAVSSNTVSSGATVGYNPDGRAEVFVRGTDGQVWHAWQNAANGAWSAFYGMGGSLSSAPAVGRNMDGRLEVFGRDVSGKMFHMYQVSGGWSGWFAMDGTISVPAF